MTEALVAMQVEREPLEEPSDVEDPIAAPLEHLHAVVEALHKPAGLPTLEVVRDLIHPPLNRPQKALELGQPALHAPACTRPGSRTWPPPSCSRARTGPSGLPAGGRPPRSSASQVKTPLEQLPLLRFELPRPFAKRPHRPCDLGILGLGQGALEPLEFLLAHRIGTVTVGPRHVEPIDDDLGPRASPPRAR